MDNEDERQMYNEPKRNSKPGYLQTEAPQTPDRLRVDEHSSIMVL